MEMQFDDYLKHLKDVVCKFAKYQKLLLVYSSETEDEDVNEIYEAIKDDVIFNKVECELFRADLAGDGYRIIIFLARGTELNKFKYCSEEFVNVFIPIDNDVLPFYYLVQKAKNNYIFFKNCNFNININCFLVANQVFLYFESLKNINSGFKETIDLNEYNMEESVNLLNNNIAKFPLADVGILNFYGLESAYLPYIEIVLLDGYERLVRDIKNSNLSLIDVYKYHIDDVEIVDKLYKTFLNVDFIKLIFLNSESILKSIKRAKDKINLLLKVSGNLGNVDLLDLIDKIKNYTKTSDQFLELYLYDVFR